MSLYKSIKKSLFSLYPPRQKGHSRRRLRSMAMMITGLLRSKKATIHSIGKRLPSSADLQSRIARVKRSLGNKWNDWEFQYFPCLHKILTFLGKKGSLELVIDGSQMGNACTALMISILWGDTAIPLCWLVRKAPKGHFPATMHQDLVEQIAPIIKAFLPPQCHIVLLGDGEFSNCLLQKTCVKVGFDYVFRLSKDTTLYEDELTQDSFEPKDIPKHTFFHAADIYMTEERFGTIHFMAYHEKEYEEPLYLVSNLDYPPLVIKYYKRRFRIETLFGNLKSRGFNIHKTKVQNPDIITGLLTIVCWAYVWLVHLGKMAKKSPNYSQFARKDRNDWSLITLAWSFLDFCTDSDTAIYLNLSMNSS
jgi:hypothetical protein